MQKLMGRCTVGDLIRELSSLPEDLQDLPIKIEDDENGEQGNIRIRYIKMYPRVVIGWYDPADKQLIHKEEELHEDE